MQDLYEILGVSRDASEDDIKRAYRRRARESHPDAGGDENEFKQVTTAYEVLKNPQARANYDQFGDPRGPGGGGGDPSGGFGDLGDLIDAFFGGMGGVGGFSGRSRGRSARSGPQSGRDAVVDLVLTLEEAAAGVRRDVDITVARPCDACEATGAKGDSKPVTCSTCNGQGAVQQVARSVFGQMLTTTPCPACRGEGVRIADPCPACRGEGRLQVTETVTVDVPPGVDEGTRLRVTGRGEAGRRGGALGDLYVRLHVAAHDVFRREGNDLHCELTVPMTQAALGAELKLPTLHGEEAVTLPAGVQTGDVVTLRRQGMPKLNGGGARGNLYVHCRVLTPTDLDERQEALLRELAALRGEDVPAEQRRLFSRLKDAFRM
ncbi:MAG TPA: J domain-containing protein [Egibacteraceae bacterium]|nr:J domain-containing protein [Egibacteraceae bacterium]